MASLEMSAGGTTAEYSEKSVNPSRSLPPYNLHDVGNVILVVLAHCIACFDALVISVRKPLYIAAR